MEKSSIKTNDKRVLANGNRPENYLRLFILSQSIGKNLNDENAMSSSGSAIMPGTNQIIPVHIGTTTASTTKHLLIKSKAEFLAGYIAACTSITLLFPLNKLIFRQILEDISFRQAFNQLKQEGLANVYRGLLPPLLQKSTSYSIMFGSQNEYYLMLKRLADTSNLEIIKSTSPFKRNLSITSLSAMLAGLTEAFLTPFERVQAVLQMQQFHHSYKHTWHVFQELSSNHGFKELYRGYTAICLRNSFSNALFFTSRTPLKSLFPKTTSKVQNVFYDFLAGGFLGATISTISYPINVVKSHMQARIGGKYFSIKEAFWLIYQSRDNKLSFLYRGVVSNFTRAIFAWGITNASYELSLSILRDRK